MNFFYYSRRSSIDWSDLLLFGFVFLVVVGANIFILGNIGSDLVSTVFDSFDVFGSNLRSLSFGFTLSDIVPSVSLFDISLPFEDWFDRLPDFLSMGVDGLESCFNDLLKVFHF